MVLEALDEAALDTFTTALVEVMHAEILIHLVGVTEQAVRGATGGRNVESVTSPANTARGSTYASTRAGSPAPPSFPDAAARGRSVPALSYFLPFFDAALPPLLGFLAPPLLPGPLSGIGNSFLLPYCYAKNSSVNAPKQIWDWRLALGASAKSSVPESVGATTLRGWIRGAPTPV